MGGEKRERRVKKAGDTLENTGTGKKGLERRDRAEGTIRLAAMPSFGRRSQSIREHSGETFEERKSRFRLVEVQHAVENWSSLL